jgi:S1-C subfamily serine protease
MSIYDPAPARYPARRSGTPWQWLAAIFILVAVVVLGTVAWWFWPRDEGLDPNAQPRPVAARGELSSEEKMNIAIYEQNSPSVVHVTNLAESRGLFSLNAKKIARGTGSGFVWDDSGHIVTNFHVIEGAAAVHVILADHSTYEAKQVWGYPEKDIAVLWIDAPKNKLRPILVGSSHDLKVGQITFAIGNPFGLDQTMTTGIVSALGREIQTAGDRPMRGAIQTSAPINPGNSGGPLLDSAGRLIGMNTAIVSPSGGSAGIGFAIPVDEINQVVPQLIRHGKVVRPQLGIQYAEDQLARQLGVDKGALIINVVPGSPAAEAGLQGTQRDESGHLRLGDVIVAINGKTINEGKDLYAVLNQFQVGTTVTVTIVRAGQRMDVPVTLRAVG